LTSGCAAEVSGTSAVTPSKPVVVFPTRAELAQLPAEAPRVDAFGTSDIAADTWTIEGAATGEVPYDDPSPVGSFVRELQSPRGATVRLSIPLRCASSEFARFFLKHRGLPTDSLRRFIVARCGGDAPLAMPVIWGAQSAASISDAELVSRARADITLRLGKELDCGNHELGMAMVREKGQAAIVVVTAPKSVELEPGSRVVDATGRSRCEAQWSPTSRRSSGSPTEVSSACRYARGTSG
jgi:hypothetical protein